MTQILEERYFTKGRVIVSGKIVKRGEAKKADYILFYKPNLPLAIVEAKDNNHSLGAGMQQALEYAETLDVPFAYRWRALPRRPLRRISTSFFIRPIPSHLLIYAKRFSNWPCAAN